MAPAPYRTVDLVLHIGLGIGLAVAAGLRPFLPALLAGGLASGEILGLQFDHGGYGFLESGPWLIAMAAALVVVWLAQLRLGPERVEGGPLGAALAGVAIGVAALLFAGTLADHHDAAWPGLVGGAACAVLAQAAFRPLLSRVRARLEDRAARTALTLWADVASLLVAGLTALLHPLGFVALADVIWLQLAGRRRADQKYAGLRILRRS